MTDALPIIQTKLYRPPVQFDFIHRSRLLDELNAHWQDRPVTLISAPAGYGKSTLASMWLESSERPNAWVSLDEYDNDLGIFVNYLVAAVQRVFPDARLGTEALQQAPVMPPASVVARQLLNDFEQIEEPFILALDDFYMIHEQAIFELIAELLRHPSPKMHLLLITRRDPPLPIASLRAYRQITEIRTQDLRFSSADTASFLTKILHREIDEATAVAWTERTEGWVTALSLAAISLRRQDGYLAIPDDLPTNGRYLQEYLLAEVIEHLDTTLSEWLLAIAWLDRFCPALCSAVYQPTSDAAQAKLSGAEFIQQLRHENLFIIPLDNENHWFRLHHLFCTLLRAWGRNLYPEDELAAIHQRAGVWFARQDFPDEAIQYLVLAGDFIGAEQVVLQHRYALMNTDQWLRLERWLHHFPEDVLESSALLTITVANLALHSRNYQKMAPTIERAEQLLANLTPGSTLYDTVLGELSVIKSVLAIGAGDVETVTTNAQRGLQLLPADALDPRSIAWGALAAGMQMSGQFSSGYRILRETINEPQWTRSIQAKLMSYIYSISFMQGELTVSAEWADRARIVSEELHLPEPNFHANHFLGVIHYLRCEPDAAEQILATLVEHRATAPPTALVMAAFALCLIRNERGDIGHADAMMDQVNAHFQERGDSAAVALLQACAVELALRRGELDTARRKQVGVDFDSRPPLWFFFIPQLTKVKLLIAEGNSEALAAARATLDEFEQQMRAVHRNLARVEALVLLALVCDAQGDNARADDNLSTALVLAQDAGLIRPFVDLGPPMVDLLVRQQRRKQTISAPVLPHVARILAAYPEPDSSGSQNKSLRDDTRSLRFKQGMHEPLTNRESQILRLLATELSPAEMSRRLSVSTGTVRTHIRNIYAKLDVHTRFEAVHCARELGLL